MSTKAFAGFCEPDHAVESLAENRFSRSDFQFTIVDPLTDPVWDRLVLSHLDYSFFHSSAWAKVLCQTYGHKPVYLHFSQAGESVALVPMMEVRSVFTGCRGVCLPFSDSCWPLLYNGCRSDLVVETLIKLAHEREWKHLELRGGNLVNTASAPAFYGHKLDLRGRADEIFSRLGSPARRAIRKASKSNLTVHVAATREAILEFYRLHLRTRRRHGLPPQPVAFFLNIDKNVLQAGLGIVVLVRSGSRSVAGAVFFRFGNKAVYKFGASEKTFQEFRGNNLTMWEGIKCLAEGGSEVLDFGRTALANEGLRRFKLSWGTDEETIEYHRFDPMRDAWMAPRREEPRFHNKVFSMLPLTVNRLAGAIIYPHLD
jgi:hypothetical protein